MTNIERPILLKVLCILAGLDREFKFSHHYLCSLCKRIRKTEILAILPDKEMVQVYQNIFELMDWYLILYIKILG